MNMADIDAGLSLCRAANWNQLPRDWQLFLQLSPNGCRVALAEDKVVGTVTTLRYQKSFSWIGMVLVDPAERKKGIGLKLLHEALQVLQQEGTIRLDATADGRKVYMKLNFVDEYPLSRMSGVIAKEKLQQVTVEPIVRKDIGRIAEFDAHIFGANRKVLLRWLFQGAPEYAFIVKEHDKIQGYCLGRNGFNHIHIGPVVANNMHVAKDIVTAALHNCVGQSVVIDILHFNKNWIAWLADLGFTTQRTFTRMHRGNHNFKTITGKQYAITGPEYG
jgi:GNAT superfamily N-acetyltransferase